MKPLLFILLLGSLGTAAAAPSPAITIANPLTPPLDFSTLHASAIHQPPSDGAKENGPLSTIPLGHMAALHITWAEGRRFTNEKVIGNFLKGLFTNPGETNWTYHAWSYVDGPPFLVASIDYGNGKKGEWWIWNKPTVAWAIQDEKSCWWFGMRDASSAILSIPGSFPVPDLTVASALAALEKSERGTLPPSPEVTDYLAGHGAHDPAVIAFFQKALAERGPLALRDLAATRGAIWDDSFLEPILRIVEASANPWGKKSNLLVSIGPFDDACHLFTKHPQIRDDPAVTHRLSKVILTIWPDVTAPATPSNLTRMRDQLFSTAIIELTQSRDRAMVPVLRPYLKVKELDDNALCVSSREGLVFARVCDHVRCAIHALLGIEPKRTDPIFFANAMYVKPGYTPALWTQWDRENAELYQSLEMPR